MDIHHFVRSSWEHNFARILQWSQLDYNYENEKFRLSDGSIYIPDFYVYADDTYYEVKGELRESAKSKLELFKKNYPDKKLILVDNKIYHNLIAQFPNINPNKHICIRITSKDINTVNNINCYRHNNINYLLDELDYKYYTNRRYDINNKQLIDINQAINILNITKAKLTQLVNCGRIYYYIVNNQIMFDQLDIAFYQSYTELKNEYNTVYINRITKLNEKN